MIKIKVVQEETYRKTIFWKNPRCGHMQSIHHTTPHLCQEASCVEKNLAIDKLFGGYNQDNRVKHFVDGQI